MELFTARGKVVSVEKHTRGHFRLIVQQNIPFKSNYLRFYLIDDSILKIDGNFVKEGDAVIVNYHHDKHFTVLDAIRSEDMGYHDECYRCHAYLLPQPAQRTNYDCCKYIRFEDHKERVDQDLKLIIKNTNQYKYSQGTHLQFSDDSKEERYHTVIYENNPLFRKKLELFNKYRVVGWKGENGLIDIVEIM